MVFIVEFLLISGFLLFVITQMLIPVIRGTRLFPRFRTNDDALRQSLSKAEEAIAEAEMERRIAERNDTASKLRSTLNKQTPNKQTRNERSK